MWATHWRGGRGKFCVKSERGEDDEISAHTNQLIPEKKISIKKIATEMKGLGEKIAAGGGGL